MEEAQPQPTKRLRGFALWTPEKRREYAAKHSARVFANMTPERHREIARMGGKRAQELGRAHRWTSEEARAAGRKGGKISRPPKHQALDTE